MTVRRRSLLGGALVAPLTVGTSTDVSPAPMTAISEIIDTLVDGDDLQSQGPGAVQSARDFLRRIITRSSNGNYRIALPVARRLMAFPGWQERLTPDIVLGHTKQQRMPSLRHTPLDAQAAYVTGMVRDLAVRLFPDHGILGQPARLSDPDLSSRHEQISVDPPAEPVISYSDILDWNDAGRVLSARVERHPLVKTRFRCATGHLMADAARALG